MGFSSREARRLPPRPGSQRAPIPGPLRDVVPDDRATRLAPVNGRGSDRLALALLAGAMAASAALVLWLQRDLIYSSDSTAWLQTAGLGDAGDLIRPNNGHLMLVPFAVFKAALELNGIDPLPLRLLGVAAYTGIGGLMWVY